MELRKDAKPFILHDGPPYANGKLHRSCPQQNVEGHHHEIQDYDWSLYTFAISQVGIHTVCQSSMRLLKILVLTVMKWLHWTWCNKCKEYALECVETQKQDFIRFGVLGEWDRPYLTLRPEFEVKQLGIFGEMAKRGHIYKGLKTVYWCTHCETALAEAEIEYAEKKILLHLRKIPLYVSEKKRLHCQLA